MTTIESMSTPWVWIHIISISIATYLIRLSFIGLFSYYDMPERFKNHLNLIPSAVLAGLAMPPLVYRDGVYHFSPTNPYLLAGLIAGFVAWRTESLIQTIVSGFVVFFATTSILMT